MTKTYQLIGSDGKPYSSTTKGALGGHRKLDSTVALTARRRLASSPPAHS